MAILGVTLAELNSEAAIDAFKELAAHSLTPTISITIMQHRIVQEKIEKQKKQCQHCKTMYVRKHTCKTVLKFQMMKDIAKATGQSTNQDGSLRQISEAYFENEPKEKNGTSCNENSLGWTNSIKM